MAFSIAAGQTNDVVVSLGAGKVRVSGTYSPGGEKLPDGSVVELRKPADLSGEKKWIATEYGNDKVFNAVAGNYVIVVTLDYAKAELPVSIVAAQEAAVVINLNAGVIAVKASGATRIEVLGGTPALDGKRPWIGTDYGAELNKAANVGTYHVVAYGDGDAVLGEKATTLDLVLR